MSFEKEIRDIIEGMDIIIPSDVISTYTKLHGFVSLNKIINVLEGFKTTRLIKGSARQGYRHSQRFVCICKECQEEFRSQVKNSNVCYDCSRMHSVKIENEIDPHFRMLERNRKVEQKIINQKREAL